MLDKILDFLRDYWFFAIILVAISFQGIISIIEAIKR